MVAALHREVAGLVRGWKVEEFCIAGCAARLYHHGSAVLVCAGTGQERARQAAVALIEKCSPKVVLSVGFAGACSPALEPGAVITPAKVVEAATGREWRCSFGSGVLATVAEVAGGEAKRKLAARYGARAVDMEAAGVAEAAAAAGCEFAAIKAISDGDGEEMDFVAPFVTPEGFATGRFVAHIALRPALWSRVSRLQRNSRLAAEALAGKLFELVERGAVAR